MHPNPSASPIPEQRALVDTARLLQKLDRPLPAAAGDTEAPSRLTPSGADVELALTWPTGRLVATLDPQPSATPRQRADLCQTVLPAPRTRALQSALLRVTHWQSDASLTFGAWLGVRPGDAGIALKLYAEIPEHSMHRPWEVGLLGTPPRLSVRHPRLCMVGLAPDEERLELYYRLDHLCLPELGVLMARIGFEDQAAELCAAFQHLFGRRIRHRIPSLDLGFSYALDAAGKPVAFTFYSHARSLFGPDTRTREAVVRFATTQAWPTCGYDQLSLECTRTSHRHGLIGLTATGSGPIALTVGIADQARPT